MLVRKMLRELRGNPTQFISIFLMTFMGILIFTGFNAVGQGMDQSSNTFYEETNLADAFLYGENFTTQEAEQLAQKDGVRKVERRYQVNATLETDSQVTIQLNFVESNQISANHVVEGIAFDPNQSGIWIDSSYAKENKVEVGDSFCIMLHGQKITETVQGLIMNPEYIYALKDKNEVVPDYKKYGYAFLSSKKSNLTETLLYNQLLMETNLDKTELEALKVGALNQKQTVLVMQKDHQSVNMFQNEINQMKAMQAIFPSVFLLIAVLTTLTTMTRITVNQRIQIGSLKAMGFSSGKILRHYMSYGAFIGSVSGILGLIIGPVFLPNLMFGFQKSMYSMPEWKGTMEPFALVVVIVCIVCCALSGVLASRKELRGETAQILRPKAPKLGRHTSLEKSKWWNSLHFDVQWNIRDLLRNKLRSAITIFGIVGCMTLIICAFGLRDTMQGLTDTAYKELNTYATKVNLSQAITPQELSALQSNNKRQFLQETAIELKTEEEKEVSLLTVVGEGTHIKQKNRDNEFVPLPKEGIAITNKTAELQGLQTNDTLKWRIYGTENWITSKIEQIIRNPIGQGVYVSQEAYLAMKQTMWPTSFVTNETSTLFIGVQFDSVQSKADLVASMDAMMETMNAMIIILIFAAVLLGVVVLYNLGVLSFHERIRELSTLKVLGFQYHMLRKLLQMQNLWLTLLGILLGIPSGIFLLTYMLQTMGDNFDMQLNISLFSYTISILGTLVLSTIVNWFLSRKLKTIDMVSALKATE